MLLNDLYTFHDLVAGEESLTCTIVFNKEHEIFNGHFPGQPVVPGVCMMQMVKEMLERHLDTSLLLRSTGQVKFLQLITPDIIPQLNISWKRTESGIGINASFTKETALFKMTGVFE